MYYPFCLKDISSRHPDKRLVSIMPSSASFVAVMHGNLTRMKIDVGSIKKRLLATLSFTAHALHNF